MSKGIANDVLRRYIYNEAGILTDIGNQFRIRHFEADKIKLNEEYVDYLYYRLFNLILKLLTGTGRLLSSYVLLRQYFKLITVVLKLTFYFFVLVPNKLIYISYTYNLARYDCLHVEIVLSKW